MPRASKRGEPKAELPLKKRLKRQGKAIAAVLAREWERSGMSSTSLSAKTGLTRSRIREITSGDTPNPGILTLVALLEGLGRDLNWLNRQLRDVSSPGK